MDKAQISAPSKPNRPSIVLTGWAERNLLLDEDQDDRDTLDGADAFTFGPVFSLLQGILSTSFFEFWLQDKQVIENLSCENFPWDWIGLDWIGLDLMGTMHPTVHDNKA